MFKKLQNVLLALALWAGASAAAVAQTASGYTFEQNPGW